MAAGVAITKYINCRLLFICESFGGKTVTKKNRADLRTTFLVTVLNQSMEDNSPGFFICKARRAASGGWLASGRRIHSLRIPDGFAQLAGWKLSTCTDIARS